MFKNNIKIFTGNAHRELAQSISVRLGHPLENCKVDHFLNHETMYDSPSFPVLFSPRRQLLTKRANASAPVARPDDDAPT